MQFHFTPTYSSWLNQVELWFAKVEREVIARAIFTSVADLDRKLRRLYQHLLGQRPSHPMEILGLFSPPTHQRIQCDAPPSAGEPAEATKQATRDLQRHL